MKLNVEVLSEIIRGFNFSQPNHIDIKIKLSELEDKVKKKENVRLFDHDIRNIVDSDLVSEKVVDAKIEIVDPLLNFSILVNSIPDSGVKNLLSQYIRIFVLVISNRVENLTLGQQAPVKDLIIELTKNFGAVPELNEKVILPNDNFLPARLVSSTLRDWKQELWASPKELSPYFFTQDVRDSMGKSHRFPLLDDILYLSMDILIMIILLCVMRHVFLKK